jgi:putative transposase
MRDGFYPQSLEKGLRSERPLRLAPPQMYINGTSTRRVAGITQELCGFEDSENTRNSHENPKNTR